MAAPVARQKNHLNFAKPSAHELVGRFTEGRLDFDLAYVVETFHLVEPAAADHTDHACCHTILDALSGSLYFPPRSSDFLTLELAACRLNVVASRPPHVHLQSGVIQHVLKALDGRIGRSEKFAAGMRIERNDVHFAGNIAQQLY